MFDAYSALKLLSLRRRTDVTEMSERYKSLVYRRNDYHSSIEPSCYKPGRHSRRCFPGEASSLLNANLHLVSFISMDSDVVQKSSVARLPRYESFARRTTFPCWNSRRSISSAMLSMRGHSCRPLQCLTIVAQKYDFVFLPTHVS